MYDLFIKATNWAKNLADTHDEQIQMCLVELDVQRGKLREAACIDLGAELSGYAQEVACRRIEASARHARELASLSLLRELELEEANLGDKGSVAGGLGLEGGDNPASLSHAANAGGANQPKKKSSAAEKKEAQKERKERQEAARKAEEEAKKKALEDERARLQAAREAREADIEAALERRRKVSAT